MELRKCLVPSDLQSMWLIWDTSDRSLNFKNPEAIRNTHFQSDYLLTNEYIQIPEIYYLHAYYYWTKYVFKGSQPLLCGGWCKSTRISTACLNIIHALHQSPLVYIHIIRMTLFLLYMGSPKMYMGDELMWGGWIWTHCGYTVDAKSWFGFVSAHPSNAERFKFEWCVK